MRRREYYWSISNPSEGTELDDLRTDQIEAVFAALPKKLHVNWWVWREGFTGWKPLSEFPKLVVSLRQSEQAVVSRPPPLNLPAEKTSVAAKKKLPEAPREFEIEPDAGQAMTLDRAPSNDDRGNHRFEVELELRIYVGEKVYKNSTMDISLKGIRVKSPLPNNLPQYFNVELRQKNHLIPMVCTVVKSRDGRPPNRLKIEVNERAPELLTLLLAR